MKLELLYIMLAVSSITFTIAVTSIFESIRVRVSNIHPKLEELIHCPYCLSAYVSFLLLSIGWIFNIVPYTHGFIEFIFDIFAVMAGVGILHYPILRAYEPILREHARKKLLKQQQELKQSISDDEKAL